MNIGCFSVHVDDAHIERPILVFVAIEDIKVSRSFKFVAKTEC